MEKETSDEDLMLNYKAGNAASFETLYRRHKDSLYRYILRNCKNAAIAEELYQDVWMNLVNARERYEVKAKFTTLLYQIAHNRLIDYYRRQQTTAASNPGEVEMDADETAARLQDQPERKTELLLQAEKLLVLIEALPDDQKQVFLLREEAGMSIQQIAELTGVNPETAKSRLRYAVNKLREGFEAYEPG